jgi:glutaminyl-peptide cyclotransferase
MHAPRTPLLLLALLAAVCGTPRGAAAQGIPGFPADRAYRHLQAQCSFGPRVPGTAGHARCLDYLADSLREAGGRVSTQIFRMKTDASTDSVTLTNVTARFGPAGAPVLLGAHWDTRPWADKDPNPLNQGRPIPGANDGASGVAVLLALATVMAKTPPPIPVELVFFDGEDQGKAGNEQGYLLGSRAAADRLTPPLPFAVIVVDMVGGRELHICREAQSERYAGWLNQIVFEQASLLGLPGFDDRVCYEVIDDHVPFLSRGIPAVDLVDMHYPQWHTLEDSPGACSQESLGQCGRLLVELLYGGSLR